MGLPGFVPSQSEKQPRGLGSNDGRGFGTSNGTRLGLQRLSASASHNRFQTAPYVSVAAGGTGQYHRRGSTTDTQRCPRPHRPRGGAGARRSAERGEAPLRAGRMYQNKTAAQPLAATRARGAQLASCGRAPVAAPGAAATARPGPAPPAAFSSRCPAAPHSRTAQPRGPAMAHSAPLGLLEQGCPIQVEHDRKRRQFTVRLNGNGGGSGEHSPPAPTVPLPALLSPLLPCLSGLF